MVERPIWGKLRKAIDHVPVAIRALSGRDILGSWGAGHPPLGGKVCLFSHWDRHGVIDDYVLHYLERLSDHGFRVDLVSTSARLEPESLRRALRVCRRVILRRNVGLDFASWKDAARGTSSLWWFDRLLLTNDSVFGPFRDLGPFFERAEREPASIWGMVDNHDEPVGGYHLQSWFLDIPRETLRSAAFRRFWRGLVPLRDKVTIIRRCEVGLSRRILDSGGTLRAAFPTAETAAVARGKGEGFQFFRELGAGDGGGAALPGMNPLLHAWDILVGDLGFPFVKTAVLKENVRGSRAVDHWPDLIPVESRWLVDVIIRFLRRAHPDSAGLRCLPS